MQGATEWLWKVRSFGWYVVLWLSSSCLAYSLLWFLAFSTRTDFSFWVNRLLLLSRLEQTEKLVRTVVMHIE